VQPGARIGQVEMALTCYSSLKDRAKIDSRLGCACQREPAGGEFAVDAGFYATGGDLCAAHVGERNGVEVDHTPLLMLKHRKSPPGRTPAFNPGFQTARALV
jgi:hypothetical protein